MLLSVILPIYNTEKYLQKALTSVQKQTFTNFECVMVDDGSTDNSVTIAQNFVNNDQRFKLFLNKHNGNASALNTALSHIKGDYVTFCDSDDYLEHDAYQTLLPLIDQAPDLIISNLFFEKYNQPSLNSNYQLPNLTNSNELISNFPLMYRQQLMYYNANKVYRRELISNLHFNDLTVGQDTIFNYQIFARCQTILFNSSPYYHYLQRSGSSVNHFDPERLSIREKETAALIHLLKQWHAGYTSQLLNAEWFNTLTNIITNIYAPLPNGKILESSKRLTYLRSYLEYCLPKINLELLNSVQIKFINQVKQCIQKNNDTILRTKYSI